MLTDRDGIELAGSQKGVTLIELLAAMVLLALVSSMLYSVLNSGIKFSRKGEGRLAAMGVERSFLGLLHRQVHGVWYDQRQNKLLIEAERDQLKLVTTAPLLERDVGLVLAVYLYDPGEEVLYYTEKLDFYNTDYGDDYVPAADEMIVLLRDVDEIGWQYDETEGVLVVSYLGRDYEIMPRSFRPEGE